MATTFDYITGSSDTIAYKTGSNTEIYPDNSNVAILGQVWLPRVYGKNLTAFEVASSGKIAITLNDIYSLDIGVVTSGSNMINQFKTKSNYSLEMATANEKAALRLDGSNNTATLSAQEATTISSASNDVSITACNTISETAGNSILLTAPYVNVIVVH